jgi:molybdopterin converting factor small subunit
MKINVKLYSIFRLKYSDYENEGISMAVDEESTIRTLTINLGFNPKDVNMIVINGKMTKEKDERINDNDFIQLFPCIPGGG